jgi:hypothetical protein
MNPSATHPTRRPVVLILTAILAMVALTTVVTPQARALSDSEELLRVPGDGGAAGQFETAVSVATDPTTGDIFMSDNSFGEIENSRIDEFTPWGAFVKAFGWDVAPGPVDEEQEIRARGTGGQYTLSFDGSTTEPLQFGASALEVKTALSKLPAVGEGVTVGLAPGTMNGVTPYVYQITFVGSLGGQNTGPISATSSSPGLTLITRTLANGSPGGTGLEACTRRSGCQGGKLGEAPGQIEGGSGVAVGPSGEVYVREPNSRRVSKFSSSGEFLLMFGEGVNHTTGADVCTAEDVEVAHDVCGVGGSGGSQSALEPGSGIVVSPGGEVYVRETDEIQMFTASGAPTGNITVPGSARSPLAMNSTTGNLYVTDEVEGKISEFSSSGSEIQSCVVTPAGTLAPEAGLAVDLSGDIYLIAEQPFPKGRIVRELSPSCEELGSLAEAERLPKVEIAHLYLYGLAISGEGDLVGAYANPGEHRSVFRVFGPPPTGFEAPPSVPPTIGGQFASRVASTTAEIRAAINPHFWTDARFYVEYGTGPCSTNECTQSVPLPPGEPLTGSVVNEAVRSSEVGLAGLLPGTTYHYRVVATSSGGGPVRGVGGEVGVDGSEGTFTTFPAALPARTSCSNQGFRVGPSSGLPDCRAYEMVSPIDKNNGDIEALSNTAGFLTALNATSPDGGRMTYSSSRSFGSPAGAPFTSQYLATRNPSEGWSNSAISAPIGPVFLKNFYLESQYKAFTPDLCQGWLITSPEAPIAPGAPEGFNDLYRRRTCGAESYEALLRTTPAVSRNEFNPEIQGFSADGTEGLVRVRAKLTSNAAAGVFQTYVSSSGELGLLCVLPNGTPWSEACSAGSDATITEVPLLDRYASITHALSEDGDRAYWTATEEDTLRAAGRLQDGAGTIYLRENPAVAEESQGCIEAGKACTIPVSEPTSSGPARFLRASPDGARALYIVTGGPKEGTLYRYEAGGGSKQVARKVIGVAGASEDLSRVYFISEEKIAGKGTNGKPNLGLDEEGAKTFIATLSTTDAEEMGRAVSDANSAPVFHAAQASADGSSLAFISTASLTGQDNTDATSTLPCGSKEGVQEGTCDSEVYVYRVGEEDARCVSCTPTGAQARGRNIPSVGSEATSLNTAASIPPANYQMAVPRVLSSDGRRLFFDSFDGLVPRDQNGMEDVYEWDAAESESACLETGAELYVAAAGGCLSLISTGESPQDSEFLAGSPSGGDIFFSTNQSLLPQDPGLVDVYDARVEGGFPPAAAPALPCQGESCRAGAGSPAPAPSPSSTGRVGGNPPRRCPKGTRKVTKKAKVSCVKPKKHKKNRHQKRTHHPKKKGKVKKAAHHDRGRGR